MKKIFFVIAGGIFVFAAGCAMFTSWRAIPPPGGCDQCHSAPISKNWFVAYKAPTLTDEGSKTEYFQTEAYTMPNRSKPESSVEVRKLQDLKCFECHRSPDKAHMQRMGRFHH